MQIKTDFKLPLASLVPKFFRINAGFIDVDKVGGILAWVLRLLYLTLHIDKFCSAKFSSTGTTAYLTPRKNEVEEL